MIVKKTTVVRDHSNDWTVSSRNVEDVVREVNSVAEGLVGAISLRIDKDNYACLHAMESLKMSIELVKHSLRISGKSREEA